MRKLIVSITLSVSLALPAPPAKADMFGGDVAVLLKNSSPSCRAVYKTTTNTQYSTR